MKQRTMLKATWIRHLSAHYNQPAAVIDRQLSRNDLEYEAAAFLVERAREYARSLVRSDETPDDIDPDNDTLFERVVRATYKRIIAERDATDEANNDAILSQFLSE